VKPGFNPKPVLLGFAMNDVALERFYSECFGFTLSVFHHASYPSFIHLPSTAVITDTSLRMICLIDIKCSGKHTLNLQKARHLFKIRLGNISNEKYQVKSSYSGVEAQHT
jgi:hypothetical protein